MEDVLKAGHSADPFRGMQFCASVVGIEEPSTARMATHLIIAISLFSLGRAHNVFMLAH